MTRRWLLGLTATVALWPASAEAQPMARSLEGLAGLVKSEVTVIVTDMKDRRVTGALIAVDHDSISLVLDGRTVTFARSEVAAVRMVDGLLNGGLIGAGAGAGAALGILAMVGSTDGYVLPSAKVGAPVMLSGIGALCRTPGGPRSRRWQGSLSVAWAETRHRSLPIHRRRSARRARVHSVLAQGVVRL